MPAGSGITLRNSAEADIPAPAVGQVTIFADADAGNEPAYKDAAGIVTSLRGADGAAGAPGADGSDAPPLTYLDHGNAGATEAVDASAADIHRLVADVATVTLTLTGWPAAGTPGVIRLWLEQDATGGRDWSFPAAVDWGGLGEPDWTTRAAGAVDLVDLQTVDGGATVVASLAGRQGPAGADGADGADGLGVPVGGTTGQVLAKASATDNDTEWVDQSGGGGLGILDQLWAAATSGDPGMDQVIDGVTLVAMGYFASVASTTWQSGAAAYTVPVGKTAVLIYCVTGYGYDNNFRRFRVLNNTDATQVYRPGNQGYLYGRDGAGQWDGTVAAGKEIKLQISTADATRRSTGGIAIFAIV